MWNVVEKKSGKYLAGPFTTEYAAWLVLGRYLLNTDIDARIEGVCETQIGEGQ